MKIIKIKFEYRCFPVWIYDENGKLIENDLPQYLRGNSDIEARFIHIQEVCNSLYLDNEKEFKYVGFQTDEMKKSFLEELFSTVNLLKTQLHGEYTIEKNRELERFF